MKINPIIDPSALTEEQREQIWEWWEAITRCYLNKRAPTWDGLREMFTEFFGEEFFKKGE